MLGILWLGLPEECPSLLLPLLILFFSKKAVATLPCELVQNTCRDDIHDGNMKDTARKLPHKAQKSTKRYLHPRFPRRTPF